MASFSNISSIHPYVSFNNNKVTNLKIFFIYNFNIQIENLDLLNKWVIYKFNICIATNVKDYKLWAYIQMNFKKFKIKYFDMLDSST